MDWQKYDGGNPIIQGEGFWAEVPHSYYNCPANAFISPYICVKDMIKKDGWKNMTSKKSKSLPKGKTKKLNTEYALPQEKYEFSLDDDATLQNRGDVYFIMELAPNTDPNELRSKLELIALGTDKIGYANYMPNIGYMVCVTNLGIYETLFDSKLRLI